MFAGIVSGSGLLRRAAFALIKHPLLLVPLLFCWLSCAPVIIYLQFYFDWHRYSQGQQWLVAFLAILFFSLMLSFASLILLELIRQIEAGERPRLAMAVGKALPCLLEALPITVVWALIWFIIMLLSCLFHRRDADSEDGVVNAEAIAESLAGYETASVSVSFFAALNKGVRMVVFLIFVAMSWEHSDVSRAVRRGLAVARTHDKAFVVGFLLTELTAILLFIPPSILFVVHHKVGLELPDWVWLLTILYCAVAWSLSMFLEQLFTAELYLWHLMWEEACTQAALDDQPAPALSEVRRPSILDDIADLSRLAVNSAQ
ncbi:hypothetical protein [Pseudaeromonas paramecii]|uniref:Uncharacterized protein n=1 Tax=Pseudaeromonas paramecii TaxID=2138166 RepID=A0ABP8QGW4_9GAMM